MLNNFKIKLDELEFQGLLFKKPKNKYSEDYWDKLVDDGTHYSKMKYLESLDQLMIDSIHLKLSYYYLLFIVALVILSVSIILIFQSVPLLSIMLFLVSAVCYLIAWFFLRSARNEHMSMGMNRSLIDLVFEQGNIEGENKITIE
jgi:hypothetical protein